MLIFIVGGSYQGKYEFAKTFGLPIHNNIHNIIKDLMETETDAYTLQETVIEAVTTEIMKLIENESCVAVCNEIGCGIVPANKVDRDYREMVGRVACVIAKKADAVYKVEAGIAQKIK